MASTENQSMQTQTSHLKLVLVASSLAIPSTLEGVNAPLLLKQSLPPQPGSLAIETIRRLRADFLTKSHRPSDLMWNAISDIVSTVELMADGMAADAIHLSSLDPGVGKTQSIVQFLPVLLSSERHKHVSAIICAGRLRQIEDVIRDARRAGLNDDDFAVFTSDEELNALGRGRERRQEARVLFTTHSMVMRHCETAGSFTEADDFHYRGQPRQVRVWDEAITPGLAVTLSRIDITSLIKPVFTLNPDLGNRLSRLFEDLGGMTDQDQFVVPDLETEYGVDLNSLERLFRNSPDGLKAANSLWLLSGKMVTVRDEGLQGNAILDYHETLPEGLAPLLVLDASSRRAVRETYNVWDEKRGGIIRLREAPKDYSPLTIHHWDKSGGKTAFKDPTQGARLVRGIAGTINTRATERWLVIHHKNDQFEDKVRGLLATDADVAFLNWGAHDATNDYADVPNVILAGTLFFRASAYEGLARASAGFPSSEGLLPKADVERVRRGEHRHLILQAICRGRVRKCEDAKCPPSDVYVIASRGSRIAEELPSIFPACSVTPWRPEGRKQLLGKVADAVAFIRERTSDGSFISDAEVRRHLRIADKSNFRNAIKKHADFIEALDEEDIVTSRQGRHSGFLRRVAFLFGNVGET
ncbi:hypothetical protein [Tardiphaga sp. 839_C3_N1_4]|uniref:hypothetical protein n=1 Tax=Tardiphaga sp. 839_C3_N1_4 TaxID=3240761 RepID=UPI003F20596B